MGKNIKHGMHGTRLYKIWSNMLQRCSNPNFKEYESYGGRGIKVCEEWKNSKSFIEWALSNGYSNKLTIDRIENDKDYSPDNCRWATSLEQNRNMGMRKDNTSGHKGVYLCKSTGRWKAGIHADGKDIHLGYFTDIDSAIAARKAGEQKYWGK